MVTSSMRATLRLIVASLGLMVAAISGTACSHVAPYERGRLAHPSMTDDLVSPAAEHVYDVHEGATGGGSPTASGCGCN
jgi:hypothetical protein